MRMIFVRPAPGFRILNPFAGHAELPAAGDGPMPDDTYWRRREAEGGVIISDVPFAAEAPSKPAKPAKE